jgi:hypothetical protein
MQINKDAEDTYIKLGINMPYEVMKKYYEGDKLYKRMLIDIVRGKYKPINKIIIEDRYYNYSKDIATKKCNIYKIISKNTEKIYIGSTCFSIYDRLNKHILDNEFYNKYKEHYVSSYEIIKYGDCNIELLESFDNIEKKELEKKESEYIKANVNICVNIQDPTSRKALYDNSEEKEQRRKERDKYMINEISNYIVLNNINISSMEDMYIVYMNIKKDIKEKLYKLEYDYYSMIMEIYRLNNIMIE